MSTEGRERPAAGDAEQAIQRVLQAERLARQSIEQTRDEVTQIGERARLVARASSARAERRIRAVTLAFDAELATRLAEIDAQAAALVAPEALDAQASTRLEEAVRALARELVGSTA